MEIEGKIIQVLPEQSGVSKAGNAWKKQEYVLETLGNFPRKVVFNFFNDRVDQNRLELGKSYVVSFDLESREYMGRWYTDVRAFASRESGQIVSEPNQSMPQAGVAMPQSPAAQSPYTAAPQIAPADNSDDLPF